MRNMKVEQGYAGDEHWPNLALVAVAGDAAAAPIKEGASQAEAEETIQSWRKIAILKPSPPNTPFFFGFIIDEIAQYLNKEVETDTNGCFGVHLGDADVRFFVTAADRTTRMQLDLVAVVDIDDERYMQTPLY